MFFFLEIWMIIGFLVVLLLQKLFVQAFVETLDDSDADQLVVSLDQFIRIWFIASLLLMAFTWPLLVCDKLSRMQRK